MVLDDVDDLAGVATRVIVLRRMRKVACLELVASTALLRWSGTTPLAYNEHHTWARVTACVVRVTACAGKVTAAAWALCGMVWGILAR